MKRPRLIFIATLISLSLISKAYICYVECDLKQEIELSHNKIEISKDDLRVKFGLTVFIIKGIKKIIGEF